MCSSHAHLGSESLQPPLNGSPEESDWYAVHTKPRHEKWIAGQLQQKKVVTFLPLLQQIHRWSDRRSKVEVPMFSCYAFVRIVQTAEERLKVLRTPGVLGFVGSEREGTAGNRSRIFRWRFGKRFPAPCIHSFGRDSEFAFVGDRSTAWRGFFCARGKMRV